MPLHNNDRDRTFAVPYRVEYPDGTVAFVDGFNYWLPERVTGIFDDVPSLERSPLSIRQLVEQTLAVRRWKQNRLDATAILRLRQRTTTVNEPVAPVPYRPREIRHDASGYVPQSHYSRHDLLLLLLRAARYA